MNNNVTDAEIRQLASDAIEGLGIAIHWWRTVGAENSLPEITKNRIQELIKQREFAREILRRHR